MLPVTPNTDDGCLIALSMLGGARVGRTGASPVRTVVQSLRGDALGRSLFWGLPVSRAGDVSAPVGVLLASIISKPSQN